MSVGPASGQAGCGYGLWPREDRNSLATVEDRCAQQRRVDRSVALGSGSALGMSLYIVSSHWSDPLPKFASFLSSPRVRSFSVSCSKAGTREPPTLSINQSLDTPPNLAYANQKA